jgi:metallo-beta-lactamase class B
VDRLESFAAMWSFFYFQPYIFAENMLMIFKNFLFIPFFILFTSLTAQVNVKFVVKQRPASHSSDTVFIAGNFNAWNPYDKRFIILPGNETSLQLGAGSHEFKLTRGGWNKVETTTDGKDIANRILNITKDTVVEISIGGWRDDHKMPVAEKNHTASKQVSLMDSAFKIPQLNRSRRIWIYLPPGYNSSKKKYPVLYMQDGQNLFDEYTSGFGEWGIDECLDSLSRQGVKESIVVGIDNGPQRMSEYNPYEFKPYGAGEGDKYVEFIVTTLKPYIDKNFRTLPNKKNTFVAGSSMGGLISMYAALKYPGIFGGAGIFSPAFWTAPGLDNDVARIAHSMKARLFFYAGGREGDRMIPDMKRVEASIRSASKSKIYERIDPEARHNEPAWRKYFPEFYRWILGKSR